MDYTIIGVALILIGPSFQNQGDFMLDDTNIPKFKSGEVLKYEGLFDGSLDDIENRLKRKHLEENPTLERMINLAEDPFKSSLLSNEDEGLIPNDFEVEKTLQNHQAKLLSLETESAEKRKRQVPINHEENVNPSNEFIDEKLTQHTQAIDFLLRMAQKNEDLTKRLVEKLSKEAEEPKLPERVEARVEKGSRRSNNNKVDEQTDNPFVRLGKVLPRYGSLIKTLVVKQVQDVSDPTPLVEVEKDAASSESESEPEADVRGAFYEKPAFFPSAPLKTNHQWCDTALLCRKTHVPVCGHDESYGYGKFDDTCHMFDVNCYFKYNFVLVPSCNPSMYYFKNIIY